MTAIEGEIVHSTAVATRPSGTVVRLDADSWKAAIDTMAEVRKFIASGLKDGEDFGTIPGCGKKPTLFKAGADKVCSAFNVYPEHEVQREAHDGGHVTYMVKTKLISRQSGAIVSTGLGCCSTLERKYRYESKWVDGERVQSESDPADKLNTVLKMAKKRAGVDATLSLSCISEHFTQDLEEIAPAEDQRSKAPEKPISAPSSPTPEPAKKDAWKDHPQVAAYNAAFEEMVKDNLGTFGAEAEPRLRGLVKGEWLNSVADAGGKNPRPDKVPASKFGIICDDWQERVATASDGERECRPDPEDGPEIMEEMESEDQL